MWRGHYITLYLPSVLFDLWKLLYILQSMQYASPKAVWNLLFGVGSPPFEQSEGLIILLDL